VKDGIKGLLDDWMSGMQLPGATALFTWALVYSVVWVASPAIGLSAPGFKRTDQIQEFVFHFIVEHIESLEVSFWVMRRTCHSPEARVNVSAREPLAV
jgi:hypothetical protein